MVKIGCICPPKADGEPRHPDGDTVELRDRLDFVSARAVVNAFWLARNEGADVGEVTAVLTEQYMLHGIRAWSVVDDKGKAVEVSKPAIRIYLFPDFIAAATVGDEADTLYSGTVVPLVMLAAESSPTSQPNGSTSATTGSSSQGRKAGSSRTHRPRPLKPSSTTTTQTGGIVQIKRPHDGDSKSLPNSA